MGGRLCHKIWWNQGPKIRFPGFFLFVGISYSQGATSVSAVPFTITVGETYALCDLDFETNLRKIDFAQVNQMISRNVTPTDIFISFTTPGFL